MDPADLATATDAALQSIAGHLASTTGLQLPSGSRGALSAAAAELAAGACGGDLPTYARLLEQDLGGEQVRRLYDRVAVGQTEFFRGGTFFETLHSQVVPVVAGSAEGRPIRLWSAGCSTGEETWSLAAVATDVLGVSADVEIIGTDLSGVALERAREGRYPLAALDTIPTHLRRWFVRDDDALQPGPALRRRVRFAGHNLVDPDLPLPDASVNLILLCNVLIYFDPAVVEQVVGRMARALRPSGFLCLGRAESLWCVSHPFEMVDLGTTFAYRRPHPQLAPEGRESEIPAADGRAAPQAVSLHGPPRSEATRREPDARREQSREVIASVQGLIIKGDLEAAMRTATDLISREPLNADAHYLLGSALERSGDEEAAFDAYGRAVYVDRSFALAHFCRAGILERRGDLRSARGAYEAAAQCFDTSDPARFEVFLESLSLASLRRMMGDKLGAC